MSSDDQDLEEPLPWYGLAGSFVGDRWMEDDSRYTCEIGHRPIGAMEKLSVTVLRRTTGRSTDSGARAAVSPELARESATNALVLPGWRAGDDEVFTIIKRVANDKQAWNAREIRLDGQMVNAYEREYQERWVVYHLTPTLIFLVAAPVALRPNVVELGRLKRDEFKPAEFES
jgi:hypothetical protein